MSLRGGTGTLPSHRSDVVTYRFLACAHALRLLDASPGDVRRQREVGRAGPALCDASSASAAGMFVLLLLSLALLLTGGILFEEVR